MSSFFAHASNVTISGGTFTAIAPSYSPTYPRLANAAAHSAFHDSPARTSETRCHKATRRIVLEALDRWMHGLEGQESPPILWLKGGAGAGKSAIMQTVAELWIPQGHALGSFFFHSNDSTRNTAQVLIPTLAYQLARSHPSAMDVLNSVIESDPLIFQKSLEAQLFPLLVQPLLHLVRSGIISPSSPRVILIDGLDECTEPGKHISIIRAIASVLHDYNIPVKFLITSRPEPTVAQAFEIYQQQHTSLGIIPLGQEPDAHTDIRRFVEDAFCEIRTQHPFRQMISTEWPGTSAIDTIVRKSSSHFIYASTVMKYVGSVKENPVHSLNVVLGLQASRIETPFRELDGLYHQILGSAAHLDKVMQILSFCNFSGLPPLGSTICRSFSWSINDLPIFLADVASLVALSKPSIDFPWEDYDVQILHVSLSDFLRDQARSQSLFIDENGFRPLTRPLSFRWGRNLELAANFYTVARLFDPVSHEVIGWSVESEGHYENNSESSSEASKFQN